VAINHNGPFDDRRFHAGCRSMPKPEPAPREPKLDTDVVKLIDAKIAEERAFLIEVVAEALVEKLAEERKEAKRELADELRALRIELAETQTTLSEFRKVLADERAKVVDLPNPLIARLQ
jgi:hypothetical protein